MSRHLIRRPIGTLSLRGAARYLRLTDEQVLYLVQRGALAALCEGPGTSRERFSFKKTELRTVKLSMRLIANANRKSAHIRAIRGSSVGGKA